MDYVNIKQRETMQKLNELSYKLDSLSESMPNEDQIALAVLDYSKQAELQAIKDREILKEVNSICIGSK